VKCLVADSSSIISLSSNCMLWVLDKLRDTTGIQLIITPEIRREVVDKALMIEKFRLSGVRVLKRFGGGVITVEESNPTLTKQLLEVANQVYSVKGSYYRIVSEGEIGLIPLAQAKKTNFMLIDERIVEKLINDPQRLRSIFENRLHMKVTLNKPKLKLFQSLVKDVNIIKSSDLIAIAHEKGLLKEYIKENYSTKTMKDFISGALWGLKDNGCSISTNDIKEYMKILF